MKKINIVFILCLGLSLAIPQGRAADGDETIAGAQPITQPNIQNDRQGGKAEKLAAGGEASSTVPGTRGWRCARLIPTAVAVACISIITMAATGAGQPTGSTGSGLPSVNLCESDLLGCQLVAQYQQQIAAYELNSCDILNPQSSAQLSSNQQFYQNSFKTICGIGNTINQYNLGTTSNLENLQDGLNLCAMLQPGARR